ncbi:hypothetical protein MJ1_0161 [Nanobdella aerobiophila]|uniref:Uncharacterized protein n=1 Tax=Nanobdella aerobiophila TaxID=2586965 RepID=A0A915SXV4_9ARCH|nr:hypothetical protein MJ1_0161 [Nanobdella aerobiophila]
MDDDVKEIVFDFLLLVFSLFILIFGYWLSLL